MALAAPLDTAAVNGVGPDTGGNITNIPDVPQIVAENTDIRTSCEYARRYYCVLANLLVETDIERDAA